MVKENIKEALPHPQPNVKNHHQPYPNYVGISCMNSVSSVQSILGQIL